MNLLLLFLMVLFSNGFAHVLVCYYPNWAHYRTGLAKYTPAHIDPDLCTHIVYAFAKIVGSDLKPYDYHDINGDKNYQKVNDLKKKNPALKVLLAVGGWTHEANGQTPFHDVVVNPTMMDQFIRNTVQFLKDNNFDGLDLDWEYPTYRPADNGDKHRFSELCQRLKSSFAKENLLLTAAVSINTGYYNITSISKSLDSLHLMTYDIHGYWESATGHHTNIAKVSDSIDRWINEGFPAKKIVLGLAAYGRSFSLSSTQQGIGAPSSESGKQGTYTKEPGLLAYYEVCILINNGMEIVNDLIIGAPYGIHGRDWVGFDNENSIKKKINELVLGKGLKGAMFWDIALDDFTGKFCGKGKYPLINQAKSLLFTEAVVTSTNTPTRKASNVCFAIGPWHKDQNLNKFCEIECSRENCNEYLCSCDPGYIFPSNCISIQNGISDAWCNAYCNPPYDICHESICKCEITGTQSPTSVTITSTTEETTKAPIFDRLSCKVWGPNTDDPTWNDWCKQKGVCEDFDCTNNKRFCTCNPNYTTPKNWSAAGVNFGNQQVGYDRYCNLNCPEPWGPARCPLYCVNGDL